MNQEVTEEVEEGVSERELRESFRKLLMNDTPCVELEEKDRSSVTLSDVEFTEPRHSQVSSIMKRRKRKRSIQLDTRDCDLLVLTRSPSSPFLNYTVSPVNSRFLNRCSSMDSSMLSESLHDFDAHDESFFQLSPPVSIGGISDANSIISSKTGQSRESECVCPDYPDGNVKESSPSLL